MIGQPGQVALGTKETNMAYRGKYPDRIKGITYTREGGLWLQSNGGQQVRMGATASTTIAKGIGCVDRNGLPRFPKLGESITPWMTWGL